MGLGFFIVPVLLRQFPLPEGSREHKLLVYFAVQTVLLLALLLVCELDGSLAQLAALDLPIAAVCLLLPWGVMLLARYLPISGWFRGGLCAAWSALWMWLSPFAIDRLLGAYYGCGPMEEGPLHIPFNLAVWNDGLIRPWNIFVLVLFGMAGIAAVLAVVGWIRRGK